MVKGKDGTTSILPIDDKEGGKVRYIQNKDATCVTFGNIYQKYYQCLCPHVDPHLSSPTAQWWVSMCIRPICVHIDHLEVLAGIEMV